MKQFKKALLNSLIAGAICTGAAFQAQAVTLTFDGAGTTGSAETFYTGYGVTFSGGGLLADGSSSGMAGQPKFVDYAGGSQIGTLSKDMSGAYSDSFFDIWVSFDHDVFEVSGDYFGNLGYGGTVTAYDNSGLELGLIDLDAITGSTNDVGLIGSFDFLTTSAIAELHMISDSANAGTLLNNLTFEASPVPVPAAVWLFGSGLMALVGVSRRKKASA